MLIVPALLAEASFSHHDHIVAAFLIAMVAAILCTIGIMRQIVRRELRRRDAEQETEPPAPDAARAGAGGPGRRLRRRPPKASLR